MKRILFVIWFILVLIFLSLPSQSEITINMNLEDDDWYWTQLNLPTGGQLMGKASLEEYLDYKSFYDGLARFDSSWLNLFFATYCSCGETIESKYVFLPTEDLDVETLVFFADDGRVFVIDVPEEIRTPQEGEIAVKVKIYR
jgi:hypothetical protein